MVSTEHDTHLYEACGILGQLALEPQQADDVSHIIVACDQGAHGHAIVGRLLPPVITDGAHNISGYPHLQESSCEALQFQKWVS